MDAVGPAPNPETISGQCPAPSPPPKPGSFFERADWQSFWLTTALALVVYLFTLCPSIELDDSGIFATGAMYAGVPDCPGFPLWTIYAHFFTVLIPFSNIAWRVSISSAMAAAFACGFIALMVSRSGALILEHIGDFRRLDPKPERWLRSISGYAAGMSFGLASCVWGHAVIVDWWPLSFALFAVVICLLMRWSHTPETTRYLYAAVFIYGLVLTNSQSLFVGAFGLELFVLFVHPRLGRDLLAFTALLLIHIVFISRDSIPITLWRIYLALAIFAMILAVTFAIVTRKIFTCWKAVFCCSFLLVLGLSLYLYPAIASMTNPPMNWGYPRTVEGFFHLISRGQYEQTSPVDNLNRYWDEIRLYGSIVLSDYGWIYLVPAAVPFFLLHRMRSLERNRMFGLLTVFLGESFFLLALLNPASDRASRDLHRIYFAPSLLILALWTGCGLVLLGTTLARPYERKAGGAIRSGEDSPGGEANPEAQEGLGNC